MSNFSHQFLTTRNPLRHDLHCWHLPFNALQGHMKLLDFPSKAGEASFRMQFRCTFVYKSGHSSALEHATWKSKCVALPLFRNTFEFPNLQITYFSAIDSKGNGNLYLSIHTRTFTSRDFATVNFKFGRQATELGLALNRKNYASSVPASRARTYKVIWFNHKFKLWMTISGLVSWVLW